MAELVYSSNPDDSDTVGNPTEFRVPVKWRYITNVSIAGIGTTEYCATSPGSYLLTPYTETGSWVVGGVSVAMNSVCKYLRPGNSDIIYSREGGIGDSKCTGYFGFKWFVVAYEYRMVFTNRSIEIDWDDLFSKLNAAFDTSFYMIGSHRFTDNGGNNPVNLGNNGPSNTDLNNGLGGGGGGGGGNLFGSPGLSVTSTNLSIDPGSPHSPVVAQQMVSFVIKGFEDTDDFNNLAQNVEEGACVTQTTEVPMYLTVLIVPRPGGSAAPSVPVVATDPIPPDPVDYHPIPSIGGGGASGNTGLGSSSSGKNSVYSTYGDSILPFDSVYLTGANYNSFISAGSGIISESGVFPKTDSLYIESIRLSVDGSSATIVEVVAFDAAPSLQITEKVYLYLFSISNSDKPMFTGYITSRRRKINGTTQEITYECNDISYFLDQLYTPSVYVYRPPSVGGSGVIKSYATVLKEILLQTGLLNVIIDLPTYTAPPVNWMYESLRSIFEWAVKAFGNYVYFVDRFGTIQIKSTTSGSFIKTYTIGDKSGEIAIESFDPILDYSRSRSRIILTGDYEITEKEHIGWYTVGEQIHPSANNSPAGIFTFYEVIYEDSDDTVGKNTKFYYFIFHPSETLNDTLLSDTKKSAEVSIIGRKYDVSDQFATLSYSNPIDVNIRVFRTTIGDSEIYCEDDNLRTVARQQIRVRYAVRSNSPIQVSVDTGLFGGSEVIKRPEFKKATSKFGSIDDTYLMSQYLGKLKDFFKPVYGGQLVLDGIDTDVVLLGKVSIDNTDLDSSEAENLICYGIEYDVVKKRTTLDLSNKVYNDLPYFDAVRERSRFQNELVVKMGLVEEAEMYKKL